MEHGDLTLLLRALAFAADKHRNQRRKGPEASPYINHPIAVASTLVLEGGVTDLAVLSAALLHDTVEDTETRPAELEAEFGTEICQLVLEVTDDKRLPKEERKRLQIQHAAHASGKAKLVKLADKICNLRDLAASPPTNWTLERRQAYFDWARQVVDGIREVNPRLAAAFDAAYARRPA